MLLDCSVCDTKIFYHSDHQKTQNALNINRYLLNVLFNSVASLIPISSNTLIHIFEIMEKRVGIVCVYGKHSLTKGLCFVRVRIETAIRTKERERENKRWDRVHNAVDMPYHKHKSLTYKPVFRCNEYEMYTIFRIKFSHAHSRIHTRIHTIVVV